MLFAVTLLATLWLTALISAGIMVAVCVAARVHIKEIHVGAGPKLYAASWGDTKLQFGPLPTASLDFARQPSGDGAADEEPDVVPPGKRCFWEAPRLVRALAHLLPPLGYVAVAVVLIGPGDAVHHVVSGLSQLIEGALSPLGTGKELVASWAGLLDAAGVWKAAGVLLAKLVALALLPLTPGSLFRAGAAVLGVDRSNAFAVALVVGLLVGLLVAASWLVAIVAYALA